MGKKIKRPTHPPGKTSFMLRIDSEIYRQLQDLAATVGVSVNQIMQGAIRWMVANAHPGEVEYVEQGEVSTRPQAGCVWFGEEAHSVEDSHGESGIDYGFCAFQLDFTERRVIREPEFRPVIQPRKSGKAGGRG